MKVSDSRGFYEKYFDSANIAEFRYDVGAWATSYLLKKHLASYTKIHLNIGCGVGQVFYQISAAQHVGVDYSFNTLVQARKSAPPEVFLIQASAIALPIKSNYVNAVSSAHVIEHIADDGAMLVEVERVLIKGGNFVIITPGRSNGIPDQDECMINGHYRRYYGKYVRSIMTQTPTLQLKQIECRHRVLGGIWNRLKWFFRAFNYPLKRWIFRDERSIFERRFYQIFILPVIFWPLELLDRLVKKRDRYFWESESNNYLMVWSGQKKI